MWDWIVAQNDAVSILGFYAVVGLVAFLLWVVAKKLSGSRG